MRQRQSIISERKKFKSYNGGDALRGVTGCKVVKEKGMSDKCSSHLLLFVRFSLEQRSLSINNLPHSTGWEGTLSRALKTACAIASLLLIPMFSFLLASLHCTHKVPGGIHANRSCRV